VRLDALAGCVAIPPAVAETFAPILRRELTARVAGGWVYPNIVWSILEALEEVAAEHKERRETLTREPLKDLDSSRGAERPPDTIESVKEIRGLKAAAELLGVTKQAIADRCRRGTLPHTRDGRGRYVFRIENLKGEAA